MTLKNNRAPLLSNIKIFASFHHHLWTQTGVTVRKRFSWVVTSVTLTFDFWPWPFAWTSLPSLVITPENFMIIRWWEHSEKGVTDRRTDGLSHSYSCLVAAKKGHRKARKSIEKMGFYSSCSSIKSMSIFQLFWKFAQITFADVNIYCDWCAVC